MIKNILFASLLAMMPGLCSAERVEDEAFLDTAYKSLQETVVPRAKWKRSTVASVPQVGGYVIGTYKYDSQAGHHGGEGFGLRNARVYVSGSVMKDFKYRLQVDMSGTPRVLDAFASWSHWQELEVKVGESKRCFTFENPYNPWDVGMGDYSQLTKKLAGMGDRTGESSMGGRDLGLQVQGDAFPSRRDGHRQLHYAVGVFNGQGINRADANRQKDFIGTLQWSPVRDLWLGAFGWHGSWTNDAGTTVDRHRYAFGLKYEGTDNHWTVRAEYARSIGHKAADYVAAAGSQPARWAGGSKADAWYATVGIPLWRWIKLYVKYDAYRDYATKESMHTICSSSLNLQPHKNLLLQLQYNYNLPGTSTADAYHQFWAQTYIRF